MKIRTKLLLFLLPTLIGSIALVLSILAYSRYTEVLDGYKAKLKSAVVTTAALVDKKFQETKDVKEQLPSNFMKHLQDELEISNLYFLPVNSPQVASISKNPHITPIHDKKMTGYAPIYDASDHLMGLVAVDINTQTIDQKFKESLFLILILSSTTILAITLSLFAIANRISNPIQRLNRSAIALAAGEYGATICSDGPKEVKELSNTLNIMSECLLENIERLKENALLKEKIYSEYESARLLQHLMLQKNIDNCKSSALAIKPISFLSDSPKGFLLDFPRSPNPKQLLMNLAEAKEEGFEAMYQLLTKASLKKKKLSSITFDLTTSTLHTHGNERPLVWKKNAFKEINSSIEVKRGDFFFLFNQGMRHLYKDRKQIHDLLSKVLKVFGQDGFEVTVSMLKKEISFLNRKKDMNEDIHLLCFQVLN